jgi:superoxide dismutase
MSVRLRCVVVPIEEKHRGITDLSDTFGSFEVYRRLFIVQSSQRAGWAVVSRQRRKGHARVAKLFKVLRVCIIARLFSMSRVLRELTSQRTNHGDCFAHD